MAALEGLRAGAGVPRCGSMCSRNKRSTASDTSSSSFFLFCADLTNRSNAILINAVQNSARDKALSLFLCISCSLLASISIAAFDSFTSSSPWMSTLPFDARARWPLNVLCIEIAAAVSLSVLSDDAKTEVSFTAFSDSLRCSQTLMSSGKLPPSIPLSHRRQHQKKSSTTSE